MSLEEQTYVAYQCNCVSKLLLCAGTKNSLKTDPDTQIKHFGTMSSCLTSGKNKQATRLFLTLEKEGKKTTNQNTQTHIKGRKQTNKKVIFKRKTLRRYKEKKRSRTVCNINYFFPKKTSDYSLLFLSQQEFRTQLSRIHPKISPVTFKLY